jgi:hypothetical protein
VSTARPAESVARGAELFRGFASRRHAVGLLAVLAVAGSGATAHADDRESTGAIVGKITVLNRQAIDAYQHLDFDAAIRILNEALELSDRASLRQHSIRARTYLTLGIVNLGGLKQREAALRDFRKALEIEPEIRISPGLANPEIQGAFDEAIASLASGGGDELAPERALVHAPVSSSPAGQPVPIVVTADKDLDASAIVLRYRAAAGGVFSDLLMERGPTGAYEAAIPAAATNGPQVAYLIEARKADGSVLTSRGSAASPLVVTLVAPSPSPGAAVQESAPPPRGPARRLYVAILGGTGAGVVSGTGEETRGSVSTSSIDWARAGHLAPQIGWFVTPRLLIGLQARLQLVSGAKEYHPPNPQPGECGSDATCSPFTGAFAGLAKLSWFLTQPGSAFQPYVSFSAGGGTIRHVSQVVAPAKCGPNADETCVDTVAGGPLLFGPGFGFQLRLTNAIGIVGELVGLVGMPDFTANIDLDVGVAFRL